MGTKIESFKIESYGSVELGVQGNSHGRGETTHKYYSVPNTVIRKLINAKTRPCLSDFESWLSKEREKNDLECCSMSTTFWDRDD